MHKKYPEHFYEPIRLEIAIKQIQHDFRKLFPSLDQKEWPNIDKDISEWPSGDKFEIGEISSFWNFFNGFSRGLKLKSLISWITAENVVWKKGDVRIDETYVSWDFPGLEFMGKSPICIKDTIQRLKDDRSIAKNKPKLLAEAINRSEKFSPRDQFPIVVFHDKNGNTLGIKNGYYIFEGNRRVVKKMLEGKSMIKSYIGEFRSKEDSWPKNYWIQTGFLRDLIFLVNKYNLEDKDERSAEIVTKFYQLLLRDFSIVRTATIDEAFKGLEKNDELIKNLFYEDLR